MRVKALPEMLVKLTRSARGGLSAGVRGLSGAITMERSEHERLKYPDRINLDKKGLHSESYRIIDHLLIKGWFYMYRGRILSQSGY